MTTLTPAYGRDYKSKAKVKTDWDNGKDFIIADMFHPYDGKPSNKEQWQGQSVSILFDKLTKTVQLKG